MYFEHLTLTNYRCFEDESIAFEEGVNVIYGRNGTGKSTLLEACFFALYGSDALREGDATLEDVIMNEEDTTTVELQLRHEQDQYTVTREVRERSGRVTQAVCKLETPDGLLEGATDVDPKIRELVRMDATAFLNCAYVRQGEIEKLIHATPSERQDLIDNLLQLGQLETYKDRASDIRVGVGRVRDKKRNLREDRKDKIQAREEKDLYGKLETLESGIEQLQGELSTLKDRKRALGDERDAAEESISEQENVKEELQGVETEISEYDEKIQSLQNEKSELLSEIESKQEKIAQTESRLESVLGNADVDVSITSKTDREELDEKHTALTSVESTTSEKIATERARVNNLESKRDRLQEEVQDERDAVASHEKTVEEKKKKIQNELQPEYESLTQSHEEHEENISELQDQLSDAGVTSESLSGERSQLESDRDELVSERSSVSGDLKAAQNEVERAQELQDQGKCPECGQDVSDAPHVNRISELEEQINTLSGTYEKLGDDIRDIDERLEVISELEDVADELTSESREKRNTEQLLEKQGDSIEDAKASVEESKQSVEECHEVIKSKTGELESVTEELTSARAELETLEEKKEEVETRIELLQDLVEIHDRKDDLKSEIEEHETEISHKDELVGQYESQRNTLVDDRDRLSEKLDRDELQEAEERMREIDEEMEGIEGEVEELEEDIGDKQELKGQVKNSITQLEEMREELHDFDESVNALDELYDQMEGVEEMYSQLRGDLRQENVRQLEVLLNEMFDLLYQNDSYDRIDLDGEYNATVVEKTSSELEPQKLSGGESALFNLSLRCAVYQLLVEGIGGTALMPPLILDEPTVHLDEGHVGKIDEIVRRMRDIGVEQTIVVSHDEEIIDSSNHRINVKQGDASNRSSATVESAAFM